MATSRNQIREVVLRLSAKHKTFKTSDVLKALPRPVSRQHVSATLHELINSGAIVKAGSTKGAMYALPKHSAELHPTIRRRLANRRLQEDEVLDDIKRKAPFLTELPRNVLDIFSYAFLEMLNNAIEHSRSPTIEIEVSVRGDKLSFVVNDHGIGVFQNVMRQRNLGSELEAIQDLLKGKTTTQPERHSGEGIFFTSKAADIFTLESNKQRLRVDNLVDDHFIQSLRRSKRGTRVTFHLSVRSNRRLREVFDRYTADLSEPGFDKTEVKVKLFALGTAYISRSQARRMLVGLEKFRSIILDFTRVPTIGQAFADEVFRVFRRQNPGVTIQPINMNEAVSFMVERAKASEPS